MPVDPFDCATYPELIQVVGTVGVGYDVKSFDPVEGQYSTIFSLPFDRSPAYTELNGVGINPVDGALYGLMELSEGGAYLVRFNDGAVAFVAELPVMAIAGDVDETGTFVWPKSQDFYALSGIADMEGFVNAADAVDKTQIAPALTGATGVADIATVQVDLGDGDATYAMGIASPNQTLRIFRYDSPTGAWTINLVDQDGSPAALPSGGYGAAWSHEDRIFFYANSGEGIFEVLIPTVDLNAKTATVARVADSVAVNLNDGTNCVGIDTEVLPPPPTTTTSTTTSTTASTTTTPPVSTSEPPPPSTTTTTTTSPPATTEIYTLSLHDALPISSTPRPRPSPGSRIRLRST